MDLFLDHLHTEQKMMTDTPSGHLNRFGISVNCVFFKFQENILQTAIIKRAEPLYQGDWALIGDLVLPHQDIEETAKELAQKTVFSNLAYFHQFYTFGNLKRHPLGRVATIAYLSIIPSSAEHFRKNPLFSKAQWIDVNQVPSLCFDHNEIINKALSHLKQMMKNHINLLYFLPEKFTIYQMYLIYTFFEGEKMDRSNFRRKILSLNILVPLSETKSQVAHRPAQLFKINWNKIKTIQENGNAFEI